MTAKDLTLNIAVNMGRLCRFASEKRTSRVAQFLVETDGFLQKLEKAEKSKQFMPTYEHFKQDFNILKNDVRLDDKWAEVALTWANILTHRAKLLD